jgi:hypothetical protein
MARTYSRQVAAPTRREHLAARRRQQRLRTVAILAAVGLLVAIVAFLAIRDAANQPGERVPDMGNLHIQDGEASPLAYNSTPPASGPHYGGLSAWGVHSEPIPDELVVHNLEDGGVAIWYDCPHGCDELVDQLESVVGNYREGVLLAPYPGMDSQIALTAWTRIDKFDAFDEQRITRFVNAYLGDDHHVRQ